MCGIAGIFFKKSINVELLRKFEILVEKKQYNRGPDCFGKAQILPNLFFYHNMLSIIDLGNAQQPMEDDQGAITYNGEIYNYKNLKKFGELYKKNSDTEVLLKGLNHEYIQFLDKTNSMFGFGYFNKNDQQLTICRDRIGIKPVYFINNEEVFAFASTISPLVLFSRKNLNNDKLWQFYMNRAFKAPSTIFDDIMELPAGSYVEFDTKTSVASEIKSWWARNEVQNLYTNEQEVLFNIEELLVDSIKNRLIADVPVGLFLSGGVDSSLIAVLTSQQTSNLNAFTVAFHDQRYDESAYAKQVCFRYGIKYNEIKVKASDFLNSIDDWITIQDDIVADPSALLLYKVSQYANSLNYRALLAGEGSDELFGGYNAYKYFHWSQSLHNFGKHLPFKKAVLSLVKQHAKRYNFVYGSLYGPTFNGTATIFEPHLLGQLISNYKEGNNNRAHDLKSALDLDIKDRIPNDILTRSDRSTSGTAIELRVPFLAHQLVNYTAGISPDLIMKDKTPKYLVKKLASKHLDHGLIYRKKVGFDLPIRQWISHELKYLLKENIDNSIQKDFINTKVVNRCFEQHINQNIDNSSKLWAFLCIELSYRYLSTIC